MLQQDEADDYITSMGERHLVQEFCQIAFERVVLDYQKYVVQDPRFFRTAEVDLLVSDRSKAYRVLGWSPKVSFRDFVCLMVDTDMMLVEKEHGLLNKGGSDGLLLE